MFFLTDINGVGFPHLTVAGDDRVLRWVGLVVPEIGEASHLGFKLGIRHQGKLRVHVPQISPILHPHMNGTGHRVDNGILIVEMHRLQVRSQQRKVANVAFAPVGYQQPVFVYREIAVQATRHGHRQHGEQAYLKILLHFIYFFVRYPLS